MSRGPLVPEILRAIVWLRGTWVMLDVDLAQVYGVKTERLNQQVVRNRKRFPPHFAFRLSQVEFQSLILQSARSKRGGRRKLPFAFTEAGAVMAANVLRSERAVELSIQVVEAFVRLHHAGALEPQLLRRIEQLERESRRLTLESRAHGARFQALALAFRKLLPAAPKPKRPVGFRTPKPPTSSDPRAGD